MSGLEEGTRTSKTRTALLTLLVLTASVALRTAIPSEDGAWRFVDIVVFAVSISTVLWLWQRAGLGERRRAARRHRREGQAP